jgi:hypothetical protein
VLINECLDKLSNLVLLVTGQPAGFLKYLMELAHRTAAAWLNGCLTKQMLD